MLHYKNTDMVCSYAGMSLDESERYISSSGGIFSLIARSFLNHGGIVYGVALSSDCKCAEYIRITDPAGLKQLRGSKYVQANMGNVFQQVETDLARSQVVLFSGTACQVNGLKSYLSMQAKRGQVIEKASLSNLYCIDVICHGVPSSKLWSKYINYIDTSGNFRTMSVDFRSKKYGWYNYGMLISDTNGNMRFFDKEHDPYMLMYLKNYSLRPSCYKCKAKENNMSDLTLGDFWGVGRICPELFDDMGTSLIITRTSKGRKMVEAIEQLAILKPVDYTESILKNPSAHISVERPKERDTFYVDLSHIGFEAVCKKYGRPAKISTILAAKRSARRMLNKVKRAILHLLC